MRLKLIIPQPTRIKGNVRRFSFGHRTLCRLHSLTVNRPLKTALTWGWQMFTDVKSDHLCLAGVGPRGLGDFGIKIPLREFFKTIIVDSVYSEIMAVHCVSPYYNGEICEACTNLTSTATTILCVV